MLHRAGFRYALHRRDLPGSPDIVFPARRKVIFINGCFWHGHDCRNTLTPRSHLSYWLPKLAANKERDKRNRRNLRRLGWRYLVIWECELKHPGRVAKRALIFVSDEAPKRG